MVNMEVIFCMQILSFSVGGHKACDDQNLADVSKRTVYYQHMMEKESATHFKSFSLLLPS